MRTARDAGRRSRTGCPTAAAELKQAIRSPMWEYCRPGSEKRVAAYYSDVFKPTSETALAQAQRVKRNQGTFGSNYIYLPVTVSAGRM